MALDPVKDIDGIHPLNAGLLRLGYDGFLPATAHAAVEIIRRIQAGGGREVDLQNLQKLVGTLVWSNCFHGQFAMTTIKTAMKAFADEWREHIIDKRCRAGACRDLDSGMVTRAPVAELALAGN